MSAVPKVIVLGRSEASMLLQGDDREKISAVISIRSRHGYTCDGFGQVSHRLELVFDDIEVEDASDPVSGYRARLRKRKAEQVGLSHTPPSREHAQQIVEFARSIQGHGGVLLCHCDAGISRSTAAAIICLVSWMGPGWECKAIEHVISLRPAASPHKGLLSMADDILNLGGALTQALDDTIGQ